MRHWGGCLLSALLFAFIASCSLGPHEPLGLSARDPSSPTKLPDPSGIENFWRFSGADESAVFSGSMPHREAGLDTLQRLGVRSILSVDAATPDVAGAEVRGMRYVHVPIQYRGITTEQRLDIVAAVQTLPRPLFVHCHHGLHRGPAAAACGLIGTGELTGDLIETLLATVGTSRSYPGLYRDAALGEQLTETEAISRATQLRSIDLPDGLAPIMASIDQHWDHLKLIHAAGWTVPADHPDLVPAAEAGVIHDHLRTAAEPKYTNEFGESYVALMAASISAASELENRLASTQATGAEMAFQALAVSCKSCHTDYRNN